MKALALAVLLAMPGWAVAADTPKIIAVWSEDSGSLPPEYAWDYPVEYLAGGAVQATYCKGYAEEAPGCATVTSHLSTATQTAMQTAIAPFAANLLAQPPQPAGDDAIPIGGGSVSGRVLVGETDVVLHAFPRADDAERVQAVLKILQDTTPRNLVAKARNRAKQP